MKNSSCINSKSRKFKSDKSLALPKISHCDWMSFIFINSYLYNYWIKSVQVIVRHRIFIIPKLSALLLVECIIIYKCIVTIQLKTNIKDYLF